MQDNPYLRLQMANLNKRLDITDEEILSHLIGVTVDAFEATTGFNRSLLLELVKKPIIQHAYRYTLVRLFGWALMDERLFNTISAMRKKDGGFNKIVDFGCGTGYLASQIHYHCNIPIVAIDLHYQPIQHFPIQQGDIDALKNTQFANDLLLLCWPPHSTHDETGTMSHQAIQKFSGSKLLYIGEWKGGCTGSNEFFDELEKRWWRVKSVEIPNWYNIKDKAYFFERR
jgi:hypothetical protein